MDPKQGSIGGELVSFVFEWLSMMALLGASIGLVVAYFAASWFGWNHAIASWALALVGFAIGFRYDYDDLRESNIRSHFMVFGYLLLGLLILAFEVQLVLSHFKVAS